MTASAAVVRSAVVRSATMRPTLLGAMASLRATLDVFFLADSGFLGLFGGVEDEFALLVGPMEADRGLGSFLGHGVLVFVFLELVLQGVHVFP